jgi:AcrR family transcriptional regulator
MPRLKRSDGSRRTEIAEAILRLAGREGIGAVTMQRIGRELGVTSGALFRHFPSRASMLNEAARLAVARLEAALPSISLPPLDRLRQFLVARSRLTTEHGAIPQLVFSEQFGKALPPKGARAVRGVALRTREFVVATLREGAARGEIRSDVAPEELALAVIGAVFASALFNTFLADDGGKTLPDLEAASEGVLRLLTPPAAPRAPSRKGARP